MPNFDFEEKLRNSFPTPEMIPDEIKIDIPRYKAEYLTDGKIKSWTGNLNEVISPVCINENGKIKRLVIGQVPSMD